MMVEDCLDVAYKTEIEAKVVPDKCHKSILSISQYSAHSALRVEDFNGPSSVNGSITLPFDFTYKIENAPKWKVWNESEMVIDEDFGHFVKVSTLVKTITPPF